MKWRSCGFQVQEAADGLRAVKIYDDMAVKPDLILVDLDLPSLNGQRCLEILREKGGYCSSDFHDRVIGKPCRWRRVDKAFQ